MYDSSYNANPNITLNPFTDSLEAVVVFKANKEFLDSLTKAAVGCVCRTKNGSLALHFEVVVRP